MSRFKVGDKVYMRHDPEEWGIISEICEDNYRHPYVVKTEYFEEMYAECELLGAKEAFLQRLQELLREFHASIFVYYNVSDEIFTTEINVGEDRVTYSYTNELSADSIMDFDKE